MKKLITIVCLLIFIACDDENARSFSLIGNTSNLNDNTILYLEDIEDRKIIDSVKVMDNKFKLNTKLSDSITQAIIHTKDFSQYRYLWLEQNKMIFDARSTDFKNAMVTGSETERLSQKLNSELNSIPRSKRHKLYQEFIIKNPNSIHSAYLLSVYNTTWGKKKSEELFNNLSAQNKNTTYGQDIAKYIHLNKNPKIGEEYVDFSMNNTAGKEISLSDHLGKITLLEFWGSNCAPCRKENPNLVKTYKKYNNLGFEIFAVSQDTDKKNWLKAIEKDQLPWTHVSELSKADNASLIYGINGIPDSFLIDENGIIVARNLRGKELDNKLDELIKTSTK
ncbi:AhpC/TSA family protein [Winogradskyella ursingii]|uniref:AhpC/TSA family protein n=1 Tax=Winogradskyella ursingii TaxID=2686079 RepID=UPI0015CE4482|nr:AhpC/TSA family protein [Winogradskyella ursingii]